MKFTNISHQELVTLSAGLDVTIVRAGITVSAPPSADKGITNAFMQVTGYPSGVAGPDDHGIANIGTPLNGYVDAVGLPNAGSNSGQFG